MLASCSIADLNSERQEMVSTIWFVRQICRIAKVICNSVDFQGGRKSRMAILGLQNLSAQPWEF